MRDGDRTRLQGWRSLKFERHCETTRPFVHLCEKGQGSAPMNQNSRWDWFDRDWFKNGTVLWSVVAAIAVIVIVGLMVMTPTNTQTSSTSLPATTGSAPANTS